MRLLPSREQFVRLWRMLERTVPKEGVQTPYLPYIRALAEELPGAEPFLRAAFCLEIFRERGLVSLVRSDAASYARGQENITGGVRLSADAAADAPRNPFRR
mgnify:CR=1 FL=1